MKFTSFHRLIYRLASCWLLLTCVGDGSALDKLEAGFRNPPASARPWVYWFPLEGNISSNGITLDLEAMKRVGIGGVLYMETDQGTPKGPADFGGPLWRNLFKHICSEANRLGIEVNMNNDAGWCGSGGPWITPELSMQKIVWSRTNVVGPMHLEADLPRPPAVKDFYQDIAVYAFPTPASDYVIPKRAAKSAEIPQEIPLRASYPSAPADAVVARDRVIELPPRSTHGGHVAWDVPEGKWTLLRMGHTTTGKDNHPAPISGRGLECDKLSKEAAEAAFNGLMAKLIQDSKPLVGEGKALVSTHIDSWEVGSQNWTPKFREEFKRLRGYDPMPLLPVISGQVIENLEVSERFLWDIRMTVNDLLVQNYAGHFRELARRHGIRLSIEAYDAEPADDLTYAGRADEPMAEFWSWDKFSAAYSCTEMSSAAHVYGKRILGAEAFTATDAEKWQGHPARIKDLGDWAFCEGVNRFVFHRYALQPWQDVRPGISMGPWGLHYERTQTWWEQSRAWHEYLARCQFLLQQGRFVADLCFLAPENSPQRFKSPVKSGYDRPGYNFDGCPPEVVLQRMKVQDGRLVLPDGMSYRMLVLPRVGTMTPALLRKVKELVAAGATIVGSPPVKSPSLSGFPGCDEELRSLARELWGNGDAPTELTSHRFGKGSVYWGGEIAPTDRDGSEPENALAGAKWIWTHEGNPAASAPPGKRYFRRSVEVDGTSAIASARLAMTADNTFECWINGNSAGAGDSWERPYEMDVKPLLKPGQNFVTVLAVNTMDFANPAGLIGLLRIKYADGRTVEVPTDGKWEAADHVAANWQSGNAATDAWGAALELGPLGMGPWNDLQSASTTDPIPDAKIACRLLERHGVAPDFACNTKPEAGRFRYIHRTIGDAEIYFVANKELQPSAGVCSFRVTRRRPELWWPDSGRTETVAVYDETGGTTRLPLTLEPYGSVFVVFRKKEASAPDRIVAVERDSVRVMGTTLGSASETDNRHGPVEPGIALTRAAKGGIDVVVWRPGAYGLRTADARTLRFQVPELPAPLEIAGPWQVQFTPNWGAPGSVILTNLVSWSEHPDPGVKYFSGTATYVKTLKVPANLLAPNRVVQLDLGRVAVMAEVKLNGKNLGILWKPPFTADVTGIIKPGDNTLEVKVVNLWINRQIGDQWLPEDSERNPDGTLKAWPKWIEEGKPSPTGRFTFTSWRLWKKEDPLVESGLLGPVTLRVAERQSLKL